MGPKDFTATLCAMNSGANEDIHKDQVKVDGADVAEGEGSINVLTLTFGKGGGTMTLPGKVKVRRSEGSKLYHTASYCSL